MIRRHISIISHNQECRIGNWKAIFASRHNWDILLTFIASFVLTHWYMIHRQNWCKTLLLLFLFCVIFLLQGCIGSLLWGYHCYQLRRRVQQPRWRHTSIYLLLCCIYTVESLFNPAMLLPKCWNLMPIAHPLVARFIGQHGAHLGPRGPRWAPCWLHEPCYLGLLGQDLGYFIWSFFCPSH